MCIILPNATHGFLSAQQTTRNLKKVWTIQRQCIIIILIVSLLIWLIIHVLTFSIRVVIANGMRNAMMFPHGVIVRRVRTLVEAHCILAVGTSRRQLLGATGAGVASRVGTLYFSALLFERDLAALAQSQLEGFDGLMGAQCHGCGRH